MTTASFDVVSLHLPRRLPGSRGHEDYDAHCQHANLHPASHIHLPLMFRIGLGSRGVVLVESYFAGRRFDFATRTVQWPSKSPNTGERTAQACWTSAILCFSAASGYWLAGERKRAICWAVRERWKYAPSYSEKPRERWSSAYIIRSELPLPADHGNFVHQQNGYSR